MTGIVDIPPSLCICITGVRLAACRSGSCARCADHRWHHEYDRCEMVSEMEFWFALIKVLAIVTFLVWVQCSSVVVSRWMATPLVFINYR